MSTAKRLFLVSVGFQLIVLPGAVSAQCVIFEKPADLFARADVVFVGTVIRNLSTGAGGEHSIVDIATLRVERSWKGRPGREVRVGADRPFELDKKYVVFAAGKPLSSSILCRWAEPEERAKTKLEWLAKRKRARKPAAAAVDRQGPTELIRFDVVAPNRLIRTTASGRR
jgi:hypothetical protein